MYKVIYEFADLQDGNHVYAVGDAYPRKGVKASAERIAELSGSGNKLGRPLIKAEEKAKVMAEPVEEPEEEAVKEEKPKATRKGRK